MSRRLESAVLHGVLIAGGVVTLFPLFWMLSASFMSSGEAATFPPHLVPHAATLDQYRQLFVRLNLGRAFFSSAVVAIIVTISSVLFGSMAGYAFAKLRFGGRDRLFGLLLSAVVIPPQVGMLPLFLLMKKLHLVNSYWGAIIPSMATMFGIFLIRQFMLSVPQDLLEAARLDGAGLWQTWFLVVIPSLRPIIEFVAVVTTIGVLTSMFGLIYVLTAGGPGTATTLPEFLIWLEQGKMNRPGYAAAISMVLFVLMGGLAWVQVRIMSRNADI